MEVGRFTIRSSHWTMAAAAMVLLKLWLVAAQPLVASAQAGHDDRPYLELANHLLDGEWLGSYSQFTLMKGPMYSLWIAGTFLAGVPLPIAQHLLYLTACVLVIKALDSQIARARWRFALFTLLWWNPMSYELLVLGRVLRQNLYTPAALLFFAALIALHTRRHACLRTRVGWAALLGVAGATLWLTREESVWALPSLALLSAAALVKAWSQLKTVRPLIAPLAIASSTAIAMLVAVCTLNYRQYGWFGTVEFRAPEFIAAYGALQRVMPQRELHYVPVTREARRQLYRVSPAFAELESYLEGEGGLAWAGASTSVTDLPASAREIGGGWFMWALRDAVAAAGHAHSAHEALAFYARIAEEVNVACDAGQLTARPRRDSLVPPWQKGDWTRFRRQLPDYVHTFLLFHDFNPWPIPSSGQAWMLQIFRDLARWPVSHSPEAPELNRPAQTRVDAVRITLLEVVGRAFCWISSAAGIAGLVVWLPNLVSTIATRRVTYLFIVSTAALMACAAVVLINYLVHILWFFNRSPGAFAQAYPLLLLGSAAGILDCAARFGSRENPGLTRAAL